MQSHWKIITILFLILGIIGGLVTFKMYSSRTINEEPADEGIILGFSQIGAESAWRERNTLSVREAAGEAGIQLLFKNAEQKQENQIKAIRSFIVYQVDVIVFVPIVAEGWDNILTEAKNAGIPVLVTDRTLSTTDENLFAGFIGTDSQQEGREAGNFLLRKFHDHPSEDPIRIIEISGTEGSSVAEGRAVGFRQIIEQKPHFQIIHSVSGDFLRSKGYEIMNGILQEFQDIDVLYSHNDGMTLGAIDAMKEAGIRPGIDIVIITIDAEQAAIDALKNGEVNCVIECNPKTGMMIIDLARQLAKAEPIPRLQYVQSRVFTEFDDMSLIEPRGY